MQVIEAEEVTERGHIFLCGVRNDTKPGGRGGAEADTNGWGSRFPKMKWIHRFVWSNATVLVSDDYRIDVIGKFVCNPHHENNPDAPRGTSETGIIAT